MSFRRMAVVIPLVMVMAVLGSEMGEVVSAAQGLVATASEVADCANARQRALVEAVETLEDPAVSIPPPDGYTFVDVPLPDGSLIDGVSIEHRDRCGQTVPHTVVAFSDGSTATIPAPATLLRIDGGSALFRAN